MHKAKEKKKLQQPAASFADCTKLSENEDLGKDFATLANAPLSKGGHFVFKSEKTWSVDPTHFSEFFTLNLKTLSAAIDCIPFNEYIDVDDKYFTNDQITSIYNNAENGKIAYKAILHDLNQSSLSNDKNETDDKTIVDRLELVSRNAKTQSRESIDNLEEDIDFLLSLTEPVQSDLMTATQSVSISHDNDSKPKEKNIPTRSIDLEKWLDSVLDD